MWWIYLINSVIAVNIVYAKWKDLKMYPYLNRYYQDNDPGQVCPSISCFYSGLDANQLNYLRNQENKYRNEYAFNMKISNLHMVRMSPGNIVLAQQKALQCLPETKDSYLFDVQNVPLLYPGARVLNFTYGVLDVAIITRSEYRNNTRAKDMKVRTLKLYGDRFTNDEALQWRGVATDMGCGYVLSRNRTHYIDYMVCIYSLIFMKSEEYPINDGLPCTDCTYYSDVGFSNGTLGFTKFVCDTKYRYLCREQINRYRMKFANLIHCISLSALGLPSDYFATHSSNDTLWDIPMEDKEMIEEKRYRRCSPIMIIIVIIMTISNLCLLIFAVFLFLKRSPAPKKTL